eukprot:PITA_07395
MKITLKPDAKPIKQRPYRFNPKYKEKVCLELDKMLAVGIIEPMEEPDWEGGKHIHSLMGSRGTIKSRSRRRIEDFIHKFLEVYFNYWMVFGLVKRHVAMLCLMLDTCRRYQITLNLKKCLFYVPFRILLGHVVCRQGLMVDPTKIRVIINLEVPRSVKQLRTTLGHTRYYRKFVKSYAQIIVPMEKLLKKDATFCWNEECQQSLDVLKENMVITPIIVFPDWKKEFHVHVDASCIALRVVLTQEYDIEVIVKAGRLNAGPNHLLCIETGEEPTNLEEGLPNAQLFGVRVVDNHFADVIHFMKTGMAPKGFTSQQKELVVCVTYFFVIDSKAYCKAYDAFQRKGKPSWRDKLPMNLQVLLQPFEKWAIDFVGLIQPPGKKMGVWYIIIVTEYLTKWSKAQSVKDCIGKTTMRFLFEYVLTRFGFLKILMSDCSTHFLNETINALTEEFQVYHQKRTR